MTLFLKNVLLWSALAMAGSAQAFCPSLGLLDEEVPRTFQVMSLGNGVLNSCVSVVVPAGEGFRTVITELVEIDLDTILFSGSGLAEGASSPALGDSFNFGDLAGGTYTVSLLGERFAGGRLTIANYAYTTPVPEPATFAMMLAGIGSILGVAGLRARRQSA